MSQDQTRYPLARKAGDMSPAHKAAAERACYDIGVAADILKSLGGAEISDGSSPIAGTSVVWLVKHIEKSLDGLDRAFRGIPQKEGAA